ncbi:hypothetical protein [Priestia aryabhattai]|uniref:DUF2249 domain-containing protein n=1 Tax=Priestia aryabhattai TaxID=412384 RepID=A0ABD7WZT1_PRIAR|nr:hypothetical protein [Priestia aryabhattai]WEA45617.1 hypothetical protein PWO00_06510 [Priestia aryabhattai]
MDEQTAINMLNELSEGKVTEIKVKKEDFLAFRPFLVNRPDFKHFRGIAGRGGDFIYTYLEIPRS